MKHQIGTRVRLTSDKDLLRGLSISSSYASAEGVITKIITRNNEHYEVTLDSGKVIFVFENFVTAINTSTSASMPSTPGVAPAQHMSFGFCDDIVETQKGFVGSSSLPSHEYWD